MAQERKKKSPYQRYNKSPFRYSAEYGRWRSAILKGNNAAAKLADLDWHNRFCPTSYQVAA